MASSNVRGDREAQRAPRYVELCSPSPARPLALLVGVHVGIELQCVDRL
jgi:hypothetical protein